jgi:tetratricopeptide (TPR) repeat protein
MGKSSLSRVPAGGIALLLLLCAPQVMAAKAPTAAPLTRPYSLTHALARGEESYKNNNYREALIFYYEAMDEITDLELKSKVHFRIGECLEGIRRYDYAAYHYKAAIRGRLPENLIARAATKLKALPKLAQHEEAMRLFTRAMNSYKRRDIRGAVDDYLASLRLEPTLMAKEESGLINDAIQYLTFLSESKEKEPQRLLKLATLLELKGETEKAIESYKQVLIIYPQSVEAREAEEKVEFFTQKRSSYLEFRRPGDEMPEVVIPNNPVILEADFDFNNPGILSKELNECAYTFRAFNEQPNVPNNRFELFSATLGKGADQKEFLFKADDGIHDKTHSFDDGKAIYTLVFREVNLTTAYVQDMYGEAARPAQLFTVIRVTLTVTKKE